MADDTASRPGSPTPWQRLQGDYLLMGKLAEAEAEKATYGLRDRAPIDEATLRRLLFEVIEAHADAEEPPWIIRHRIVIAIVTVLTIALAEPAIVAALPPEVRHILELEHGPLAYGLTIVGAIVGTAAVTGRNRP